MERDLTRVDARQEGVPSLPVADRALGPRDLIPYATDDGTGDVERSG
jgi:hypothetical protein